MNSIPFSLSVLIYFGFNSRFGWKTLAFKGNFIYFYLQKEKKTFIANFTNENDSKVRRIFVGEPDSSRNIFLLIFVSLFIILIIIYFTLKIRQTFIVVLAFWVFFILHFLISIVLVFLSRNKSKKKSFCVFFLLSFRNWIDIRYTKKTLSINALNNYRLIRSLRDDIRHSWTPSQMRFLTSLKWFRLLLIDFLFFFYFFWWWNVCWSEKFSSDIFVLSFVREEKCMLWVRAWKKLLGLNCCCWLNRYE